MRMLFNKHHNDAPENAVYIGRGSPYGNPFIIGKHGDRETVICRFETETLPNLDLELLRNHPLICFCHPQKCHGIPILKKLYGDRFDPSTASLKEI